MRCWPCRSLAALCILLQCAAQSSRSAWQEAPLGASPVLTLEELTASSAARVVLNTAELSLTRLLWAGVEQSGRLFLQLRFYAPALCFAANGSEGSFCPPLSVSPSHALFALLTKPPALRPSVC